MKRAPNSRPILSIVTSLGRLSKYWLDKNYRFRKEAVKRLVCKSGFEEEMSQKLLDALFSELTNRKLIKLLAAELGDPGVLDGFRKCPVTGCWRRAIGPRMITHICASNVPGPAIVSFVLGMLTKSINIGKVSSKDEGFLDIYLDSLKAHDKALAGTNYLIRPTNWRRTLEFIKRSDLVVAYGNHETLEKIRETVPARAPFVAYGHRVSFGVCLKEALNPRGVETLARKTACDIWMMGQRGCLSPTAIYLEKGGKVSPLAFSQRVARHLLKKGQWVTLYEEVVGDFPLSSGHKIIYFKAFGRIEEVYRSVAPLSEYLQALSLEAEPSRRMEIAGRLSSLGANRICRAGRMQNPPVTWHHDGMPNLASWVRWTDLED